MRESEEESYWSRVARSYEVNGEYVVGDVILQAIRERLLEEPDLGEVIELGCGTGYFAEVIASNARHVIATDISNEMLEVARVQLERFKNVWIQKSDCARTPFAAERFDTVLMVNLIHVLNSPSECLREGYRILRHGGTLIAIDFTGYRVGFYKKIKLVFRYLSKWGLPPHHHRNEMSPNEVASLVRGEGFEVEDLKLLKDGSNALYLKALKK